MRLEIIRQPNKRWAIFDGGSDTFWLINKTKKEIISILGERAKRRAEEEAQKDILDIENGKDPYEWGTIKGTKWGQAVKSHNKCISDPKLRIKIKEKMK